MLKECGFTLERDIFPIDSSGVGAVCGLQRFWRVVWAVFLGSVFGGSELPD